MNICIVGTGYVGLVTGVVFASIGHYVICVDQDADKVQSLSSGRPGIYEPYLEQMLNKAIMAQTIRFTSDLQHGVRSSDVVFICVGTPSDEFGNVDMTQYQAVLHAITLSLNAPKLIVNKSTVPVGTAAWAQQYIKQITPQIPCEVASNPEFLREGQAVNDTLKPERIIIGVKSLNAIMLLTKLYEPLEVPIDVCEPESAELVKYASNSFLATKISFVNWLAMMADHYGADIQEVTRGMGTDSRIGSQFLNSGLGYGGSCFPKDVSAAIAMSQSADIPCDLLKAVQNINVEMPKIYCRMLEYALSGLQNRKIAIWGLAFKPGTDDVRDSQAVKFVEMLLDKDASVVVHDPAARDEIHHSMYRRANNIYDAADGADAICLLTDWSEYMIADTAQIVDMMRQPFFLDARNVMDSEKLEQQGWTYLSFGRTAKPTGHLH